MADVYVRKKKGRLQRLKKKNQLKQAQQNCELCLATIINDENLSELTFSPWSGCLPARVGSHLDFCTASSAPAKTTIKIVLHGLVRACSQINNKSHWRRFIVVQALVKSLLLSNDDSGAAQLLSQKKKKKNYMVGSRWWWRQMVGDSKSCHLAANISWYELTLYCFVNANAPPLTYFSSRNRCWRLLVAVVVVLNGDVNGNDKRKEKKK